MTNSGCRRSDFSPSAMILTRREVLLGGAALTVGALPTPSGGSPLHSLVLDARPGVSNFSAGETGHTPVWGYGGGVPGPTIRLRHGDRLSVRLENHLPQPSTVHWHGLRIPNAMDGVSGLTQAPVEPGQAFLYEFTPPDAGTFWYHAHHRSWEQVARGLYGALIVEDQEPPRVDHDQILLVDDVRLTRDGRIAENFGSMHDWTHAGRLGNTAIVNGRGMWTQTVSELDRLRLRLVNAANARILVLEATGLEGWIIALDGQPLATPESADRIELAPGQRADLLVDVTAHGGSEAHLSAVVRNSSFVIARFPVRTTGRRVRLPPPEALPQAGLSPLGDLRDARRAQLDMEGGAMGRLRKAKVGDRLLEIRELVAKGKAWAMNGIADIPGEPLFEASPGETVRLLISNKTAWPHGMHLHGHHFHVITGGIGPARDTVLLNREETTELAFVADNPGDWLLHCHMLEHADSGMTTWFRVAAQP